MAKLFVKNDFMFTFPFNALQKKLRILLDYNVDSSQVMQCLYIFGLAEQRIIERVEQFISMGIPNIQLSTFKFTEENFQKYFHSFLNWSSGCESINLSYFTEHCQPWRRQKRRRMFRHRPLFTLRKRKFWTKFRICCRAVWRKVLWFITVKWIIGMKWMWNDTISLSWKTIKLTIDQLSTIRFYCQWIQVRSSSIQCHLLVLKRLFIPIDDIKTRLSILRRMKPRNIVDFVPLLRIPTETLSEIAGRSKAEHKNKIYYFSEKLQVRIFNIRKKYQNHFMWNSFRFQIQPWMVANAFADYADIFFYQFDLLTSKLDLFLSYNMNAQDILSDLPAFERSVASLTHKLNLLSVNKNEPIRTWMLCTDGHRFNR